MPRATPGNIRISFSVWFHFFVCGVLVGLGCLFGVSVFECLLPPSLRSVGLRFACRLAPQACGYSFLTGLIAPPTLFNLFVDGGR